MIYAAAYLLIINLVTFAVYGIDKRRARQGRWRIQESTLLLLAVAGGTPGALAGMFGFHHKTKHLKFMAGVPLILFLQILLIWFLFFRCEKTFFENVQKRLKFFGKYRMVYI